jgi:choline dehydrogenase-like flavoprotein
LTTNLTYAAEAKALWQTNKTGPKSSHTDTVAFLPYQVFTSKAITDATVSKILAQVQNPGAYLPPNTHPTILAGYAEQLKVIAQQFESLKSAVFEIPFGRNSEFYAILVKPLSRGRVTLDPKDDGVSPLGRGNVKPLVDYRTRSNPIDKETTAAMLAWMRWWMKTPVMENTFHPFERQPGLNVTTDTEIQQYIAENGQPGNGHASGTARIGPKELGGVLGPDLRVHGVKRLSVADCSVMPIIVASHTSSTAYAVGEKVIVLNNVFFMSEANIEIRRRT